MYVDCRGQIVWIWVHLFADEIETLLISSETLKEAFEIFKISKTLVCLLFNPLDVLQINWEIWDLICFIKVYSL